MPEYGEFRFETAGMPEKAVFFGTTSPFHSILREPEKDRRK